VRWRAPQGRQGEAVGASVTTSPGAASATAGTGLAVRSARARGRQVSWPRRIETPSPLRDDQLGDGHHLGIEVTLGAAEL